jgi:hypothetical protein
MGSRRFICTTNPPTLLPAVLVFLFYASYAPTRGFIPK